MGAKESRNTRKNMAQMKSKERREEPLGTMSYQTISKRSPPFWLLIGARKLVFFWHQSEARTAATVWNWSGKTLSPGALLAVLYFSSFHIYFPARLDFPHPLYLPLGLQGCHFIDSYMVKPQTPSYYCRQFALSLRKESTWKPLHFL